MVWAGVCSRGKTPLVFCEQKMDGPAYVKMVDEYLLPLTDDQYIAKDDYAIFQQDHASCHTAKVTQD